MKRASVLIVCLSAIALSVQAQSPSVPLPLNGRVLAADTGAPLRHARVQATIASQMVAPVFTDADGRFVVAIPADVPSRLSVTKPGYVATTFTAPRTDGGGDLRLPKAGAISGRITDTLGDPVVGMTVTAEIPMATTSARRAVTTAQTDDLGDYRLSGLPEGNYWVSVNSVSPLRERPAQRKEIRTYYPGAQTNAQPIALSAGEERGTIDFSAPAMSAVELLGPIGDRGGIVPKAGIIRGRVVATTGRALPQAEVRLDCPRILMSAPKTPDRAICRTAATDQEGRYEFQRLDAGTYAVTATKGGFLTTQFGDQRTSASGESIELRPRETRSNIDIALPRLGAIVGRVLDDAGEPVEGASVHVLQVRYADGRRRLFEVGEQISRHTDDRGIYRVYNLTPDEYIVSASVGELTRSRSLEAVVVEPTTELPGYATSYFPGTGNPGEAQRVTVDLAQNVAGVDFALTHAPTARITGTVVDAAGNPITDGLILAPSRRAGVLATNPVEAHIDPDGRFEFLNVVSGEYVLQANQRLVDPYDEGESASQFITVAGTDVTGVTVRLSRGSTIKGHITFDGTSPPESYDLQAVPVDMDRTPQNLDGAASARIQPDGTFEMAGLSGPRVLRLVDGPRDWTLKAVLLNGRDITDMPLAFGTAAESIERLEVVLTDRVSEVKGQVVDARRRGIAGATVIVFATDRAQWGDASRFVVSAKTETNGAFNMRRLPPGDYYIAAVTRVAPGEWRDPDLLDALVPGVAHVTISEGDTVTVVLRAATQ